MTRPIQAFRTALLLGAMVITGSPAFADSGQWRWAVGAQLDPASHGIVDLGYRTKDFSIQWLTDTLDLRYKKAGGARTMGAWSARSTFRSGAIVFSLGGGETSA